MKDQNFYINQQDLLDHAKNPRNYGVYKSCDFLSAEYNPSCGDSIVMCGMIVSNHLGDLRFEGKGCMLSLAMASKLTDHVKGMSLNDILAINSDLIAKLLGMELGPNRMQCGMLAIAALLNGVKKYRS